MCSFLADELLAIDSCWDGESILFEGLVPGGANTLHLKASLPTVYVLQKFDFMGKKRQHTVGLKGK